ncbi:sensor histidine kinase [Novosphingobium rosa]|uniref:sensor histidine kinase n=1 Tax=Novosphingobium rosa TaxID=76978 RepID=UPI0008338116|nr:HAMP domain-containing sensor histidine kinase [Novosphingobium rosa]
MDMSESVLARAHSDAHDQMIAADEPLAGLQLRCGGALPGPIAIPELQEVVAKARRFGLKLARAITAQDGHDVIRAWVEVQPRPGPNHEGGCDIVLRHWQSSPLPAENADLTLRRRAEIDRALAEMTVRLDARQNVLAVTCDGGDLAEAAARLRAATGHPWTDVVTIPGSTHRQPLHWRLLDGASVDLPGSARRWRATLIPTGLSPVTARGAEPGGFDLCLTSDTPAPLHRPAPAAAQPVERSVIGSDLAPVLRQPIARIIANAETIRTRLAGPLSEDYTRYAADIAAAGEHLMGLVDDLADLDVIEAEGFSTIADTIDLADAARRAAGILSMRAREKGITISAPALDVTLPAVAEFRRVLQILLNLIGNAIRYSPDNSTIIVDLSRDEGFARVAIADQGPGLSPEDQPRIFEKFERLGRSGDGGSGLGLYISRRLARAMGGELSVVSAKGEGACFLLDVPAGGEGI